MKNDKTMKAKTKSSSSKTTAATPAAKAPEATPVRQEIAKASEALPVRQQSAKVTTAEAPVVPAAKPQTAPPATPVVIAQAPQRQVVAPQAEQQATQRREITSDLIALRAYNLWEQQGRPQGREKDNWLLAESQLKQEIRSFTA